MYSKKNIFSAEIPYGCPYCKKPLNKTLECRECGFRGYIKNGLTYLHADNDSWKSCNVERDGWVSYVKEIGLYVENDDHFYIPDGRPHLKSFYAQSKLHLDAFTKIEDLNHKLCLNLGAGIGWAEVYLLKSYPNANLIAMEVNDDPICGLGRSPLIQNYHGVMFNSLVADMHDIPLLDNSVDIVYSVDALHHFRDIVQVFDEIYRVLKPGGYFYALNEPDRPEGTNENEFIAMPAEAELRHGIIERRPTLDEWLVAGKVLQLGKINEEANIIQHIDTPSLILRGFKI